MIEEHGWQRPEMYMAISDEISRVRGSVGICDLSPRGKFDLKGEEVQTFLNRFLDTTRTRVGQAAFCNLRDPSTSLATQVLCCNLCDDQAAIIAEVVSSNAVFEYLNRCASQNSVCIHLTDMTSSLTGVCVVGPESREVLSKLTELNLSEKDFPDLMCAQGKFANVHTFVIRADMTTELAYQVYFGREYGGYVWDAIVEAGEEFDIQPFGFRAMEALSRGK